MKKAVLGEVKSYILITFFLALYSVAIVGFIINSGIVGGGLSGLGTIVFYLSGNTIPVGYTMFAINAILLAIALKVLGRNFGVKTIYGIFLVSIFMTLAQRFITEPFLDDITLSVILGGGIVGFCFGSLLNQGGSTGGTDLFAKIVNKYRRISPGRVILYFDICVISSAFFLFHFFMDKTVLEAFRLVVYGFILVGVASYMVDRVILGEQQSVQMMVFSKKHKEIADEVGVTMRAGVTLLHGRGWYSQEETDILLIVIRKNRVQNVLRIIKDVDPQAFASIGAVTGVYGKGFSEVKKS
ncbi:MAG: YitT family protein [Bacteroidales bacterium]|nr:YitT family protein [Bacteroidales bacterium]